MELSRALKLSGFVVSETSKFEAFKFKSEGLQVQIEKFLSSKKFLVSERSQVQTVELENSKQKALKFKTLKLNH